MYDGQGLLRLDKRLKQRDVLFQLDRIPTEHIEGCEAQGVGLLGVGRDFSGRVCRRL